MSEPMTSDWWDRIQVYRKKSPEELEANDRYYYQETARLCREIRASSYYPEHLLEELAIVEGARMDNYNGLRHRGLRPADRIIDPPTVP